MIPYSTQSINKKDLRSVEKVLKSDLITQGKMVPLFEKKILKKVKAIYGIATNSGTSALHIACLSLDLKPNDWLWTVSNTFVASANCGRYCGAKIDFVDIDPLTWNISIPSLEHKLLIAKRKKKLPKILVIVHFAGQPAEITKIYKLSKKYKFKIIEDASHALGSKINNQPIGNCKYSDIAVFSFHPVKSITTAEGGMAVTNNKKYAQDMKLYRNHGITRDVNQMKSKNNSYWYYEQVKLGYNYRMNDLEAALGVSQLSRLDFFIKKRNKIAKNYITLLKKLPVQVQKILKNYYSSYHLFVIRLQTKKLINSYDKIFRKLRSSGVGTNLHYLAVHKQPYYKRSVKIKNLQQSELHAKSALSLPIFPELNIKKQKYVVQKLSSAIGQFI